MTSKMYTTAFALFTAGYLTHSVLSSLNTHPYPNSHPHPPSNTTPSPLKTHLPTLNSAQQSRLPYPPDLLPGARDISTPNGTIRAYEWGPLTGPKVLFIHGITTPCVALAGVAHVLADAGYRVLLFDLPGRGYSDNPIGVEHDVSFFTAQIWAVLASSEVSWTGKGSEDGFLIVGYSLGGGITAAFASYFERMLNGIVLIAPSGLLRDRYFTWSSRVLYSRGWLPERLLRWIVKGRLREAVEEEQDKVGGGQGVVDSSGAGAAEIAKAEVTPEHGGDTLNVLSKKYPGVNPAKVVNYEVDHHQGFVAAFMSSIRYGPVRNEHARWRELNRRLTETNNSLAQGKKMKKVLVILGEQDPIMIRDETMEDIKELLGEHAEFKLLDAGHDVPMVMAGAVAEFILEYVR